MDTALFYPSHLHLTADEAAQAMEAIVEAAERHGGALTLNWHDRSLAPERLWGDFYVELLEGLKRRGPWFPTAAQAVSWFQRRRSVRFHVVHQEPGAVRVALDADIVHDGPGLTLRVYKPSPPASWPPPRPLSFSDVPFKDTLDARVEI
jgi:hypothetical protein